MDTFYIRWINSKLITHIILYKWINVCIISNSTTYLTNLNTLWRHLKHGLTSTDVVDTAYGYILKQANEIIIRDIEEILEVFQVSNQLKILSKYKMHVYLVEVFELIYSMLDNLVIFKDNMLENINRTYGIIFSQRVMNSLINKGLSREDSYDIIQTLAMHCFTNNFIQTK